jgi:hypothetical protein
MKLLITLFFFVCTASTQAALYKSIDANGDTIYSDKAPYAGAKQMVPPFLQSTPAVKPKPKPKPEIKPEAEDTTTKYLAFAINQPLNEETIRSNEGNVSIMLKNNIFSVVACFS